MVDYNLVILKHALLYLFFSQLVFRIENMRQIQAS